MAEENKTEVTKPAAEPATAGPKKSSPLKIVLLVLGVFLLLAAAVVGYGFINGKRIKDYAGQADKWMKQVDTFGDSLDTKDTKDAQTQLDKFVKDSASLKSQAEKSNPPAKATKLKQNLVEYFGLANTVSAKMYDYAVWAGAIQEAGTDIEDTATSLNSSSPDAIATSMEKARDSMQATYDKISAPGFNVPKGAEKTNEAFKKMLKDMIAVYNKMIPAIRANDFAAMNAAMSDLTTALTGVTGLETGAEDLNTEFKADIDRADALEKEINTQIGELRSVNFSF